MDDKYYMKSQVLSRKWTEGMIKKLLGDPDKLKDNPHGRRAAPMKLFLVSRVEAAEKTQQFADALEAANKRRKAISGSIAKKRNNTIQDARNCSINVVKKSRKQVLEAAIESYNCYNFGIKYADPNSDRSFLDRITVNYIRHRLTEYDFELSETYGKIGVNTAKDVIRARVYEAIAEAYPHLKNECIRQAEDRFVKLSIAA